MTKRHHLIIFILLIGALIICLISILQNQSSKNSENFKTNEYFPVFTNCVNPQGGNVEFSSKVFVHNDFVKHLDILKHPEKAVSDQLKFLKGSFNWDDEQYKKARYFNMVNSNIEIISVNKVKYPQNLEIDWIEDNQSLYPSSFRTRKSVSTEDDAIEISYKAKLAVVKCGDSTSELSISLPRDPYLAYWILPKNKRREIGLNNTKHSIVPCAHKQMVEMKMPSLFWYVWAPHQKGVDANGEKYNCEELLLANADYLKFTGAFAATEIKKEEIKFQELAKLPVIKSKIIYGFLKGNADKATLRKAYEVLGSDKDLFVTAKASLNVSDDKYYSQDVAVWTFLHFLLEMERFVEIKKQSLVDKDEYLLIEVSGILKSSKKPLEMQFYFGPTDEVQGKAKHWGFLYESLKSADLLFYVGHSGLGEDMSFGNMKKRLKLSDAEVVNAVTEKTYQLFNVTSCFSQSYYGEDYSGMRAKKGMVSDTVMYAGGGYGYLIPMAVMRYLDKVMAGQKVELSKVADGILGNREGLVVRRISGK